jgi:hypothetical protein
VCQVNQNFVPFYDKIFPIRVPGDDFWCVLADQNNTPRGLMHLHRGSVVTPWHQRRLTNTSQLGLSFDESALNYGQVMITPSREAHTFFSSLGAHAVCNLRFMVHMCVYGSQRLFRIFLCFP